MSDQELEEIEIRLLLDAIYARYGYDLRDYAPTQFRRQVLSALAKSGLENLGQFQHRVLIDAEFFSQVLEQLTVRVSEIFRDPTFYRTFRATVVPILRTYPLLNATSKAVVDWVETKHRPQVVGDKP